MSTDARSICRSIHRSTCRPNIGRHIGRYATDIRPYVNRVSADMLIDMSTDTRPIVTVDSRPTGVLSTHDPRLYVFAAHTRLKSSLKTHFFRERAS